MKKLKQHGFGSIEVVLLVVVLGLIGGLGYYVYQKGKTLPVASTSSSSPASTATKPQENKSTVPEGFVEYENKELGFKFAYPKTWGDISVTDVRHVKEPSDGFRVDTGKRWLMKFSNEKSASLGLTSKDWTTELGRGGGCTFADGSGYKSIPNPQPTSEQYSTLKILSKSDQYFLTEVAGYSYCQDVTLFVDYIYGDNPTYLSLRFAYNAHNFASETEFNEYQTNSSKFVSAELIDTITKIAKSIRDL